MLDDIQAISAYKPVATFVRRSRDAGFSGRQIARYVRRVRASYPDLLARYDFDLVARHGGLLRHVTTKHHGVPPGRYAMPPVVMQVPGGNDLVFYEVRGFDDERLIDHRYVLRLAGPSERMVPRRQVPGVFRRLSELGPELAAARYRRTIGRCDRCGARLTGLASRERHLGGYCAALRDTDLPPPRPRLTLIDGGRP